jgi:hypothetical protein
VDHPQRFIYLGLMIAWAIFRLIRYVRAAGSKAGSRGARPPPATLPAATPQSPLDPLGGAGGRSAASLAAVGVVIAGNVVVWPLLFMLPALDDVPTSLRVAAGVLVNFFLVYLARAVAGRAATAPRSPADDQNPIK